MINVLHYLENVKLELDSRMTNSDVWNTYWLTVAEKNTPEVRISLFIVTLENVKTIHSLHSSQQIQRGKEKNNVNAYSFSAGTRLCRQAIFIVPIFSYMFEATSGRLNIISLHRVITFTVPLSTGTAIQWDTMCYHPPLRFPHFYLLINACTLVRLLLFLYYLVQHNWRRHQSSYLSIYTNFTSTNSPILITLFTKILSISF